VRLSALSAAGADFLTEISGVSFDQPWPRRLIASVEVRDLPFPGRDPTVAMRYE